MPNDPIKYKFSKLQTLSSYTNYKKIRVTGLGNGDTAGGTTFWGLFFFFLLNIVDKEIELV